MEPPRRFGYYDRLSAKDKATYRKSDAVGQVPIPDAPALFPLVKALSEALREGKRARVATAATTLSHALLAQLGVGPVKIHVRLVRPALDDGELHGLYTYAQDGKPPKLEVWMRTAAQEKVVAFRTFLRTLVHELAHHLDVAHLRLEDSFHTEGFFRRESSLVRQLLADTPRARPARAKTPEAKQPASASSAAQPKQLSLF